MDASTRSTGALVLATLLTAVSAAAPASAIPVIDPPASASTLTAWHRAAPCALERIGAQPVRCDDLTGLGLPAPASVPEQ